MVLEQIKSMKKQGISDEEIVRKLQEQGISPRQISESLDQSQTSNAVSNMQQDQDEMIPSPLPEEDSHSITKENTSQVYQPKTQEIPQQEYYNPPQPMTQEYQKPTQEQYAPQPITQNNFQDQTYPQEQYQQPATSTDIIIEVAEQIFDEKIAKIAKQTQEFNEFKTLSQTKIQNLSQRLEKIEKIIDKLQIAILEKVGSYGQNLNSIKNEMSMMQDSFGKMINPLIEKNSFQSKTPSTKPIKNN